MYLSHRPSPRRSRTLFPLGLALGGLLSSSAAWAFGEDICYPKTANSSGLYPAVDCLPLPSACNPSATTFSSSCRTAVLNQVAATNANANPGRSTVHSDATYLMAQVVGFLERDAYWISVYDQAIDFGSFTPADINGVAVGSGTAVLDGLVRNNFNTGGVLFHFLAPRNNGLSIPNPNVNGLKPVVSDPNEVLLANLRGWALSDGGSPSCAGGLTTPVGANNYATGPACYLGASLTGALAAFSTTAVPFNVQHGTGPQIIQARTTSSSVTYTYAPAFPTVIDPANNDPALVKDARLAVYLHALADRISHHVCTDKSVLTGPTSSASGKNFDVQMTNPDCDQGNHFTRHALETGVTQSLVATENATTVNALNAVFDELVSFARARGLAGTSGQRDALIADLVAALGTPGAATRVCKLVDVASKYGVTAYPGAASCAGVPR